MMVDWSVVWLLISLQSKPSRVYIFSHMYGYVCMSFHIKHVQHVFTVFLCFIMFFVVVVVLQLCANAGKSLASLNSRTTSFLIMHTRICISMRTPTTSLWMEDHKMEHINGHRVLDGLHMEYRTKWPVNMLLSKAVLAEYNKVC